MRLQPKSRLASSECYYCRRKDDEQSESERRCEIAGSCLCWRNEQWIGDNCEKPQ
jgi:hypothetical protein